MKLSCPLVCSVVLCALVGVLPGCSEFQARRHAREGNRRFRDGDYRTAVTEYEQAEAAYPGLAPVALNKGLACRQLMTPGARTPENQRAIDCALKAFNRLQEIKPDDRRGEQLYVQTLFDADRYDALAAMYEKQLSAHPGEIAAINALIQVYSRWGRWEEGLRWTAKRADLLKKDAEAQYSVGVSIFTLLFQKGGGNDKTLFDPRVAAQEHEDKKDKKDSVQQEQEEKVTRPSFGPDDIVGAQRVSLADQGISYLQKAVAIRPTYRDAMIYLNLLYRQKSFAFFDNATEWQACIDAAESWRNKAIQLESEHK